MHKQNSLNAQISSNLNVYITGPTQLDCWKSRHHDTEERKYYLHSQDVNVDATDSVRWEKDHAIPQNSEYDVIDVRWLEQFHTH